MKTRARTVLITVVLIGGCGVSLWQTLKEDCGIGVDSVSWLPPEARNIAYVRIPTVTIKAEFEIEQEPFVKWCAGRGKPLHELTGDGHRAIHRCLPMLERRGFITPIIEPNDAERKQREVERSIKNFGKGDLFYEERWKNGGGYAIGYNVKEKRGYYDYAHH